MKLVSILVLTGLTAALAGASAKPAVSLAKVNGESVTSADVLAEFVKLHGGHAKFLGGESEARAFLEKVIDRKLLIQEAYRLGLDRQDDIRKAIDEFEEKKAVDYLLRTEIEEKAVPTEAEIKDAWEKNTSIVYELRLIEAPTREEATAVYLDVLEGKSFEGVARSCSTLSSRMYGGKLPLVGWGSLDPAVEAAAFALEPGDTSPPVKSATGWDVARMEEIHPVERPEFDKAKMRIEGILRKRKLEERRAAYSAYLAAKYHASPAALELSVPALARALDKDGNIPVETWDGGGLPVKEFVTTKELVGLGRMPAGRAEEHLEQLRKKTVNEALARREAKERGIANMPEVADEVTRRREELMEAALYADYVLKDLKVTDEDVRADFDKHASEWTTPERRRVSHILVKTKDEAEAIKKRLDAGEPFAEVAKKESIDTQSKNNGGDLGWIVKKDVPPAFSAVLSFKSGQITDPIPSKFGWHLIRVTAIDPPKPMKFEEAKDQVRKSLVEREKTKKRAEWLAKLRAAAKIKIDDANLREFAKANAADSGDEKPAGGKPPKE